MSTYLAVAVGGVFGCWARYYLTGLIQGTFGRSFPYATLTINVLGSFLMGFLFIETIERIQISPAVRTGVLTGVIGGFTTFSTFAMETLLLADEGKFGKAALYVLLSMILGLGGVVAGAYIARNL